MALDSDIQDIFSLLGNFLSSIGLIRSKTIITRPSTKKVVIPEGGFSSPITTTWSNLGDFLPGVKINKMHPKGHNGIDMKCPKGTPVCAFAAGRVLSAGVTPGNADAGGTTVTILHAKGLLTYYAHLSAVNVTKGQMVAAGEQIGSVGNSGNARNGPEHLHFEIHSGVDPKNPTSNWNSTVTNPGSYISVPTYGKTQLPKEEA